MQSSTSTSASGSAPQAFTSTHASDTQTLAPSHSSNVSPQTSTTTGNQERSTTPSSSFLVSESFTSTSFASTVSPSLPTGTSGSGSDARETHELVIDTGDCGAIGTPMVIDYQGNRLELESLGGGRFTVMIGEQIYNEVGWLDVFMADDGGRCGQHAECPTVVIRPNDGAGIRMTISSAGERGYTMYPLSIWMDDAVTTDGQPAYSSETASHCWGWTEEECPNSQNGINFPLWTISSESPKARAFVTFCPPNGPDLSRVGGNPNTPEGPPRTWGISQTRISVPVSTFLLPHTIGAGATTSIANPAGFRPNTYLEPPPDCVPISTCFADRTRIPTNQISTISPVPGGPPEERPPRLTTYTRLDATTTILLPTLVAEPTNQVLTSWIVRSTDPIRSTVQSGWAFATLPPSSMLQPSSTPSTQDALGHLTTESSFQNYIVTSWTTWMEVNGSTVPAIAGQAAVETTVPVTYALESDTIIPVDVLRSLSIESTRTASSSPTSAAARDESGTSKRGTIVAAIVGMLVGLVLGGVLVWFECYKRRRLRSRDYLAQASPSRRGGRKGGLLDLDAEAKERGLDREMVVEPWVLPVSVARRKQFESPSASTGEGSSVGRCGNAGPGRELEPGAAESGPSSSQSLPQSERHLPVSGARGGKPVPPTPAGSRPRLQDRPMSRPQRPEPPRPERVQHHDVTLSGRPRSSPPTSSEATLPTPLPSLPRRTDDDGGYNAIPPSYNEEWRTTA